MDTAHKCIVIHRQLDDDEYENLRLNDNEMCLVDESLRTNQ